MDLEQAEVHAFFYAKVVELGSFEAASKLIQVFDIDCRNRCRVASSLSLDPNVKYRIKPETVAHPGGEYPKPVSDKSELQALGGSLLAFIPELKCGNDGPKPSALSFTFEIDDPTLGSWIDSGVIHASESAAIGHAKVLFGDRS